MKCEIIIQPRINCHLPTREEEVEKGRRSRRGRESERRKKGVKNKGGKKGGILASGWNFKDGGERCRGEEEKKKGRKD